MSDQKPTKMAYSPELAVELCARIAEGMSLTRACADAGMPSVRCVFNWRRERPEFGRMVDQARADHADMLADECVDIADNDPDPQRAKNRIEARKWRAGTIKPRNYGPRMDMNLEVHDRTDFGALHREALDRCARMAIAKGITIDGDIIRRAEQMRTEDAQVVEALPAPAGGDADPFS